MTPTPDDPASAATREWDTHLARQLENKDRAYTFDMDEMPEEGYMARFPALAEAIRFLDDHVKVAYYKADAAALAHQKTHRRLAGVAIIGGALAIVLAIGQLALKASHPGSIRSIGLLEGVAVGMALAAVAIGFWAKFDHQWFIQRHIAERLRMLKFQALGQATFWSGQRDGWQHWVRRQIADLQHIADIRTVKAWATGGQAEPFEPVPPSCPDDETATAAVAIYYRRKRVDFQAAYFKQQSEKLEKESAWLHGLGLPLFFASNGIVIVHFLTDAIPHHWLDPKATHILECIGVWALALAAILPVLGFAARAWVGAFERTRSAHQFHAKHQGLLRSSNDLLRDQASCAATMHHIAHLEHFLEHEHREWLRLLMDAEWFL